MPASVCEGFGRLHANKLTFYMLHDNKAEIHRHVLQHNIICYLSFNFSTVYADDEKKYWILLWRLALPCCHPWSNVISTDTPSPCLHPFILRCPPDNLLIQGYEAFVFCIHLHLHTHVAVIICWTYPAFCAHCLHTNPVHSLLAIKTWNQRDDQQLSSS